MVLPEPIREYISKTSPRKFAELIDHTLLKPQADYKLLEKYVDDTRRYGFKALMLPLSLIPRAKEIAGNTIRLATVIGFPLGNTSTEVKIYEALQAAELGVSEIDMVININALKSGDYDTVLRDIRDVVSASKKHGIEIVKVIIETGLLTDEEKIKAAELVVKAGADYVKTCTGFLGGIATVHDVSLLYRVVRGKAKVKASGGIRHALDAIALVLAGADRLGTSSGDKIIEEYEKLTTI
ncbi:MAG: deoxyribose-phosphate aldolase [Thermoprotei archaeon]